MSRLEPIDLCVVGCGPTGVAALFEARRLGLNAIGIETGTEPLSAIRSHMEGLVYYSPASDFEVAGVPLDCRSVDQCTREDVLHYFARLINWGGLAIWTESRWIALETGRRAAIVTARTRRGKVRLRAANVLVTSWYRPRPLPSDLERAARRHGVAIHRHLWSAAALAGKRVAVVGGGLSGFAHASALMMAGATVTLVLRRKCRPYHRSTRFSRLLALTGSVVIQEAGAERVTASGLSVVNPERTHLIPCDALVCARGTVVDDAVLRTLRRAGVLTAPTVAALKTMRTVEDLIREGDYRTALDQAIAERPDLWTYLFDGVHRVRFAGGLMHAAGPQAGTATSIATGLLAVRAIAGAAPPANWKRPLARALRDTRLREILKSPDDDRLLESVIPIRVTDWSRGRITDRPDELGLDEADEPRDKYLLVGPEPLDLDILGACDGIRTAGEIVSAHVRSATVSRVEVLAAFRRLWYRNALTWVPPIHTARDTKSVGRDPGVTTHRHR